MSWSLQLRNGDLTIGGASLGTVNNQAKLVQDLRCAILERMGTDPDHPWFGSLIDGGRLNGVEQESLIGTSNWNLAALSIEAEIRRIVSQYQTQQINRTQADRTTYGKPTLTPQELLMSVANVEFFQAQDNLLCRVTLVTGTGTELPINVPLGTATI